MLLTLTLYPFDETSFLQNLHATVFFIALIVNSSDKQLLKQAL